MRTGNPTINATLIPSEIKNGITPLKVSIIGTSFAKELITKTFSPTGGVIRPTSTTIRVITPNHNFKSSGLSPKSKPAIIGQKIGTVNKIMDSESIINPKRIYITNIIRRTVKGGNPDCLKKSAASIGSSENPKMR